MSDSTTILQKASRIRLAAFDVDGVLTNGELIFTADGIEQKRFHVHDGLGLKMLQKSGCEIAIITSRQSTVVASRMDELGIRHVYQGREDKQACLLALMKQLGLTAEAVAYAGDDIIDLPAMQQAGLAIAVANAHPFVRARADWTTTLAGGAGAVREICDLLLRAQGKLDAVHADYLR